MDPRYYSTPTAPEGTLHPPPPPPPPPPPSIDQQQHHQQQQQPGTKRPHASAVKSRSASSYPRKRAVSACLVCRGRKTKCDNQRPQCGFCRQNGAECVYEAEKLATFDAASLAILDRLSRIEALLDVPAANNQPASHPSPHASSTSGGAVMPSNATTIMTHSSEFRGSGHPQEATELFPINISIAAASRVENVLQWPAFCGKIATEDILAPVFEYVDESDEEDSEEGEGQGWSDGNNNYGRSMEHQNGQPEHHDGGSYSPSTKKGPMYIDEKDLLQCPGGIRALVKRFFSNVHTKNPILDSSELEKYVKHVVNAGEFDWNGKSCLLLLVCALGSLSAPYSPNSMSRMSEETLPTMYPSTEFSKRFFAAAKKRLGIVLSSNQLVAVQCLFLTGIYHMYTFHQFSAWKIFNAASVSCEGYLHRKEKVKNAEGAYIKAILLSSESTRHLEQRIYWSCLKSELELCAELEIAHSSLNEFEYPHAFPSPPREISTSQAFQSSNSFFEQPRSAYAPEDRQTDAQLEDQKTWFYYLAEIALRKVEIRMSGVFKQRTPRTSNHDGTSTSTSIGVEDDSSGQPTIDDLLNTANEFELQLDLWLSCLPPILKFPSDPSLPCGDERLQYLRQRYWWNLSRVYRPFIYYLLHNPHAKHHPKYNKMLDYATKGLKIDIDFILSNVITHRHHGAWLTLRALTSNSVIILVVKKKRILNTMPLRWNEAINLAKSCLSYWESEVRDARKLKEAIEQVEIRVPEG